MKKLMTYVITASLLLLSMTVSLKAATPGGPLSIPLPTTTKSVETNKLQNRLAEISRMDKSGLAPFEKKQLRKETRSIKKELKQLNGGVYLSAGAVVLLVVLLIILL